MNRCVLSNRKALSRVFAISLMTVILMALESPSALGQSTSAHQQTLAQIHPSALEMPCHLWAVDVDDLPIFDARWVIGVGNSVQVRIKGNFACATMPSVSDPNGNLKGRCTRTQETSEAVYLDASPLFGETDVHVGFNEIRIGLVYHLSFSEFGTPLYLVGY
jgi:hypothetical protein